MSKSKANRYRSSTTTSLTEEIKIVVVGKNSSLSSTISSAFFFLRLGDGYTGKVGEMRSRDDGVNLFLDNLVCCVQGWRISTRSIRSNDFRELCW